MLIEVIAASMILGGASTLAICLLTIYREEKRMRSCESAENVCERSEIEPLPFADSELETLRDALEAAEAENAELRRMVRQYHKLKGKRKKD